MLRGHHMKEFKCDGCEYRGYTCDKGECNYPVETIRIQNASGKHLDGSVTQYKCSIGVANGGGRTV